MTNEKHNDDNINFISLYEVVKDRYGKKHKIYSVRFKDVQTVMQFTEKYSTEFFSVYLLTPVIDEEGNVEKNKDGSINTDNGFYDDLLDLIQLALDYKETKEEIEEWLDMNTAQMIVETFIGLSQFKKKQAALSQLVGEISSQVSSKIPQ